MLSDMCKLTDPYAQTLEFFEETVSNPSCTVNPTSTESQQNGRPPNDHEQHLCGPEPPRAGTLARGVGARLAQENLWRVLAPVKMGPIRVTKHLGTLAPETGRSVVPERRETTGRHHNSGSIANLRGRNLTGHHSYPPPGCNSRASQGHTTKPRLSSDIAAHPEARPKCRIQIRPSRENCCWQKPTSLKMLGLGSRHTGGIFRFPGDATMYFRGL